MKIAHGILLFRKFWLDPACYILVFYNVYPCMWYGTYRLSLMVGQPIVFAVTRYKSTRYMPENYFPTHTWPALTTCSFTCIIWIYSIREIIVDIYYGLSTHLVSIGVTSSNEEQTAGESPDQGEHIPYFLYQKTPNSDVRMLTCDTHRKPGKYHRTCWK